MRLYMRFFGRFLLSGSLAASVASAAGKPRVIVFNPESTQALPEVSVYESVAAADQVSKTPFLISEIKENGKNKVISDKDAVQSEAPINSELKAKEVETENEVSPSVKENSEESKNHEQSDSTQEANPE
jgi:hypothetical protein